MTHGEELVLQDANEFVRQSAEQASEEPQTSGIRPHPLIEATEQTLDTARFGLAFTPQPTAEVEPGGGGGGGGEPLLGACCVGSDCSVTTEDFCDFEGGNYQGDGTTCDDPNPCLFGACCTGGICTEGVTEEECLDGGGVYQGGGSSCGQVVCTLPPCQQGCATHQAFDGSMRFFETKNRLTFATETRDYSISGNNFTITTHNQANQLKGCSGCLCTGSSFAGCAGDCGGIQTCTGNPSPNCSSFTWSGCEAWGNDPPDCFGSPNEADIPCVPPPPFTVVSATLQTQHESCDLGPGIHYDGDASEILSDECLM